MLRCEGDKASKPLTRGGAWGPAVAGTFAVQICVLGVLALACWGFGSGRHVLACITGGAAVAIPHLLLALSLWLKASATGHLSAASLLAAEGLKLLLIMAALYGSVRWLGPDMAWEGFLVGIIGALKAQWLALWFTRGA